MNKQQQEIIDNFINENSGRNLEQIDSINGVDVGGGYLEQRARELGWINGYQWGKEYPTNGKKPDLPDDVVVNISYSGDWKTTRRFSVSDWGWEDEKLTAFRIVDERYKPMSKSDPEMSKECLNESKPDNSWHDRGELPPVGVECQYSLQGGGWTAGTVVYIGDNIIVWKNGLTGNEIATRPGVMEFRPIKSEREKFVEAAMHAIDGYFETGDYQKRIAGALYDAGFRAPN